LKSGKSSGLLVRGTQSHRTVLYGGCRQQPRRRRYLHLHGSQHMATHGCPHVFTRLLHFCVQLIIALLNLGSISYRRMIPRVVVTLVETHGWHLSMQVWPHGSMHRQG
jgi:hypothetical protein